MGNKPVRITLLHAGKDSIYANVITTDGQHIVREQIRVYNRRGRCVRTVFDESYTDEKTIFSPRNQLFFSDRKGLSLVRIENNDLKTISLNSDRPEVTDSLHLDETLIAVRRGQDSTLYVSSLYGIINK